MALKQQIQAQLVEAMKAKDETKVSVLRMVKAAILKFEVSGDRKEATDEDILTLINKEIKARRDAAEQFKAGNRLDKADAEEKEVAILMEYMPPQLSEEEVAALAKEAIATVGAQSKADMGKVMSVLMPKVQGKADGSMVSKVVNALLG